jgi:hypothetical protein
LWEQPGEAESACGFVEPESLHEACGKEREFESATIWEQAIEDVAVEPVFAGGRGLRCGVCWNGCGAGSRTARVLHFNAEGFEEPAVLNTAGAGCFAAAAIETGVEVPADGLGERQSAVDDGAHEIDAAAGAVIFIPGFDVCGTGGCAKAAVDAVEKAFVGDRLANDRDSR